MPFEDEQDWDFNPRRFALMLTVLTVFAILGCIWLAIVIAHYL